MAAIREIQLAGDRGRRGQVSRIGRRGPRSADDERVRVVFLGNAAWSVPPLEALAASSHDVGSCSPGSRGRPGRGNRLTPTPVAAWPRTARTGACWRSRPSGRARGFEALGEAARTSGGRGVRRDPAAGSPGRAARRAGEPALLAAARASRRGARPAGHPRGDVESTGVTTIRMDAGMDTGPILLQAERADPERGRRRVARDRGWP